MAGEEYAGRSLRFGPRRHGRDRGAIGVFGLSKIVGAAMRAGRSGYIRYMYVRGRGSSTLRPTRGQGPR